MLLNQQLQKLDLGGGIIKNEEWEEVGKVKNKERVQGKEGRWGTRGRGEVPPLGLVNSSRAKPALDQIFTTLQTE